MSGARPTLQISWLGNPELPRQPENCKSLSSARSTLKGIGRRYQGSNKTPCHHHQNTPLNANIPTRPSHKWKQVRSGKKNHKLLKVKVKWWEQSRLRQDDEGQYGLQVSASSTAPVLLLLFADKFLAFRDDSKWPAHQRDPQEKMTPEDHSWNHSRNDLEGPCSLDRFTRLLVTKHLTLQNHVEDSLEGTDMFVRGQ